MAKRKLKPNRKRRKRITAKAVQETECQPVSVPQVDIHPEPDDEDCGDDGLTPKQRAFVAALAGPAAGNATKAAKLAGYSDNNAIAIRVTAHRTLTNANVQRALARAIAENRRASKEWVRAGLIELAGSNMADYMAIGPDGESMLDMAKAAEAGALGAVREIREEVIKTVGDGKAALVKRTLKLYDRRAALESLAKISGLLPEAGTQRGAAPFDLRNLTDDELRDLDRIASNAARRAGQPVSGSN